MHTQTVTRRAARPRSTSALAVVLAVSAVAGPAPAAETLVIEGVRVFDGERMLGERTVVVRDGVIAELMPGDVTVPETSSVEGLAVVDGAGRTLLPGLIDAHTHSWSPEHLERSVVFGVTTTLDMFTPAPLIEQARRADVATDGSPWATLKTATYLLTAPGGHGTQYGIPVPTVVEVADVAPWVKARVEDDGADYIKIICEDGTGWGREIPCISEAVLREAVEQAHAHERLAVVHVSTIAWARRAVDAGTDVLVHVFRDAVADEAFVDAAKAAGIAISPTLSVFGSMAPASSGAELAGDERLVPFLDDVTIASLEASFPQYRDPGVMERTIESVRRLHAAGVPILAGTDAPNPATAHGVSMHGELALLVDSGLTPSEALAAATSRVADVYGLEGVGRIRPGHRADLLLVEGDPTTDIHATRSIAGVWKDGRPVERTPIERVAKASGDDAGAAGESAATGPRTISDFDDGTAGAGLGAGWSTTTDGMAGGTSTANLEVAGGGATGSAGCLRVTGRITAKAPNPWAGAQFSPGAGAFRPADLSAWEGISFRARGDGRTYAIVFFTAAGGFTPAVEPFTPGDGEWTEHRVSWKALGSDGTGVTAIMFTAGAPEGSFTLDLDDVVLERGE